jgi:anti-sigma factor RsiW
MNEKAVYRYLDNEMMLTEKESFENHLSECSTCSMRIAQIKKLNQIMHSTPDNEVPQYLSTRILAEARAMDAKSKHRFSLKFVSYGLGIALSLYLGVFTAIWSTSSTATVVKSEQSIMDSYDDAFLYSSLMGE